MGIPTKCRSRKDPKSLTKNRRWPLELGRGLVQPLFEHLQQWEAHNH